MIRTFVIACAVAVVATACSADPTRSHSDASPDGSPHVGGDASSASWDEVASAADGQTVRWWMFGGDERINRYVDEEVAPRAQELGVTIERVPIDDTAAVVQRVAAELRGGRTESGGVDLIWINGENFAEGKRAGLWREDWATDLPNAELVDWDDPTIARDFGVPVDGQESPWSRAVFVFAYDQDRMPEPPRSYEELAAYAEANPGRITYPAPPDFTGGAFVRQVVQALGEDDAFALLERMRPHQWREGRAFPTNEAELNQLFGNGEVDLAMSYDPGFVASAVRQGTFPESARPLVLDSGALQNTSYVTIPVNATHAEGAMVVANLLLEPELQAIKADPERLGIPTVLDLDRLSPEQQDLFSDPTGATPYHLDDYGMLLTELAPDRVVALEERWREEVLR